MFAACDAGTLETVWQSLFKRYNQVLQSVWGERFLSAANQDGEKAEGGTTGEELVEMYGDVYNAAVEWWADGVEETND